MSAAPTRRRRDAADAIRAEAAVARTLAATEGSDHAAGRAAGLARAVTIVEAHAARHVSPAVREHLVEQVVEAAKHLRVLALSGVELESDIFLDTLAHLGDVTQRLADFDRAQGGAS